MAAGSRSRADSWVWGQRGQKTAAELWGGVSRVWGGDRMGLSSPCPQPCSQPCRAVPAVPSCSREVPPARPCSMGADFNQNKDQLRGLSPGFKHIFLPLTSEMSSKVPRKPTRDL